MKKIKVSADTMLTILKNLMNIEEVNYTITDVSAPIEWQNKKVQEILNVDYYTFRHRPVDTEVIIQELLSQSQQPDRLLSLNRAFCLLSLGKTERVFSKETDILTTSASLEYWIQSDKIKILEDMFEDLTVETTGERIPIQIGTESRQMMVIFSGLNVTEIEESTEFGEMSIAELQMEVIFYPSITSKSDYQIEFRNDQNEWEKIPFTGLTFSSNMTQKSVPLVNRETNVGNINLSKVKSISLTFDGHKSSLIETLTEITMIADDSQTEIDNNKGLMLKITRNNKEYTYACVIKDHIILIKEDGSNETHSLTLTARGIRDVVT